MKRTLLYIALASTVMGTGCTDDGPENRQIDIELTRSESDAVEAVNDFSFDLLRSSEKRFGRENPNYIMSPQSVAWSVAMVANGAEPGSETQREMLDVLHLGDGAGLQDVNDYCSKLISAISGRSAGADIRIANALHYKKFIGIRPDYVNTLKTFYGISTFEDSSNEEIDGWISGQTGGMINDFARRTRIDDADFGVINTLYFSGLWKKRFDTADTKNREFRNYDGTVSTPPVMSGKLFGMLSDNEACHFLKINFKGESFSINFILPQEGKTLDDVRESLDGEMWEALNSSLSFEDVLVRIPKLEYSSCLDLKDVVKDMGLRKAFAEESELTRMAEKRIIMDKLDQMSVIKLDETGAKVSTSTNFSGMDTSAGFGFFYLDEPFYFFITEESTGAILFLGKVSQL